MEDPGRYAHAKVFKITGKFNEQLPIPEKFFYDMLAMVNTFLALESDRLKNGTCYAAAWPAHRASRSHFCYYFTFGGADYKCPDVEAQILCNNLARRMTEWINAELQSCYPEVLGVWVLPLFNILDESSCCN